MLSTPSTHMNCDLRADGAIMTARAAFSILSRVRVTLLEQYRVDSGGRRSNYSAQQSWVPFALVNRLSFPSVQNVPLMQIRVEPGVVLSSCRGTRPKPRLTLQTLPLNAEFFCQTGCTPAPGTCTNAMRACSVGFRRIRSADHIQEDMPRKPEYPDEEQQLCNVPT